MDRGNRQAHDVEKPKRPFVLITRRRPTREHGRTIERLRSEAAGAHSGFDIFRTEISERTAIAEALGKINEWPSFSQKWKDGTAATLEELVSEVEEAVHGS